MPEGGCLTRCLTCSMLIMLSGVLLLLVLHDLRMARAQDPHLNPACQAIPNMPPAEKMSLPRRQARQRLYRSRVRPGQPTLDELLASESSFDPQRKDVSVTAILNHWSRHTICKQIDGLRAQTFPPTYIWVCLFASPMADQIRAAVRAYNDSRIALIEAEYNFKYYGRFQLALAAQVRLGAGQGGSERVRAAGCGLARLGAAKGGSVPLRAARCRLGLDVRFGLTHSMRAPPCSPPSQRSRARLATAGPRTHAWAHTRGHTRLGTHAWAHAPLVEPRPISPRPISPRPISPRPISPRPISPRRTTLHTSAIAHLCYCTPLLLHTSAIAHLCSAQTSHVLVLDDDMLPGSRYLQQLLHVIHSPRRRGLLGSIGWLLPRPNQELRFGSYRSLVNDSGGLCVPRPVGAAVRVRAARAALP